MRRLTPDAFADRFKECSRALWCIAAAIVGDADQAQDVLQEAALIALNKLDGFDPDTAFTA
ncbi:MAG: RNA polymerase sigma factor, partial [Planctomycetota bacterium]